MIFPLQIKNYFSSIRAIALYEYQISGLTDVLCCFRIIALHQRKDLVPTYWTSISSALTNQPLEKATYLDCYCLKGLTGTGLRHFSRFLFAKFLSGHYLLPAFKFCSCWLVRHIIGKQMHTKCSN